MAEEQVGELPEDLNDWVDQRAAEEDQDRSEVLARAVAAYRVLEAESEELNGEQESPVILEGEGLSDRLEALDEDLDALETRVGGLEDDLDEKISDVRQRVVQIKREIDGKASADHTHDELRERATEARAAAEESVDAASEAHEEIEQLRDRVDDGFDNFEDVLEYLTETTDDLEEKTRTIARVLLALRDRVSELEGTAATRDAVAELKAEANSEGITAAKCENCDATVQIGLLSTPRCHDCGSTFSDVDPARSFFRSATLRTGSHPALKSGDEGTEPASPDELFQDYEPENEEYQPEEPGEESDERE